MGRWVIVWVEGGNNEWGKRYKNNEEIRDDLFYRNEMISSSKVKVMKWFKCIHDYKWESKVLEDCKRLIRLTSNKICIEVQEKALRISQ